MSSGIVGYNNIPAPVGFSIFPVQFSNVGGSAASVDLLQLLTGTYTPVTFSQAGKGQGTQIWVLNNKGTYNKYYYLSDAYDEVNDDDAIGWADAVGTLVTSAPAALGDSFWLVNGTEAANNTFVCAGEVLDDATKTLTLASGFQLAACPYPKSVAFEDITWSSLVPVTFSQAGKGQGTQIWVLNNKGTYNKYYYLSDAYDEVNDDDATGWADSVGTLVSGKIADIGVGFWIVMPANGTVTFSK